MSLISDPEVQRAVANIIQRSEKQTDLNKLVGSYVDVGVLPQLLSKNSQILYGRRGTGKTHLATVLVSNIRQDAHNVALYLDARTLGSTSQFSDPSLPLSRRCVSLFRDVLGEVNNALLENIINHPTPSVNQILTELAEFSGIATQPITTTTPKEITEKIAQDRGTGDSASANLSASAPSVQIGSTRTASDRSEQTVLAYVTAEDKIIFPAVNDLLKSILEKSDVSLVVVIDEWSSIPLDIQPYLAEFIKHSFLPIPRITVKIATLEYRSRFSIVHDGQLTGFEVGSDIATGLDLDDYFVYDRNPEQVTKAFADILHRHIESELPPGYLKEKHGINDAEEFVTALFTNTNIFQELVRASEGVARDLINIFSQAFWATRLKGRDKIEKRTIIEAARQWFEQDKAQSLGDDLTSVLQRIVTGVIGKRRARSFLLPRELEKHETIQRLFDLRVVHLVRRGYADKDNPGVRYNIYTLDYGTYVDLLGTTKAPDLRVEAATGEAADSIEVPSDDKRSIRRIVLTRDILEGKLELDL